MYRIFRAVATFTMAGLILSGCHSSKKRSDAGADSPAVKRTTALPVFEHNPQFREHVNPDPVAEYKVKTDSKLNDQYFLVQLYETKETMKYRLKVDFEGLGGDDTVKLPDMGTPPKPAIQKGPEEYSCIVGLIDKHQQFRELKKVYVTDKGRQLKITRLKRYVVTEGYRLVEE